MASGDTTQKKRNNYKLLVDPELKKGHKKVYRLNGKDVPGFPPVGQPKDPRTQKTVLGVTGSQIDLKMPRFKYDKHWVGDPPEWDVFVIGLNENVKGSLLKEVCTEMAPVHAIKIPRHPKTKTFLGAATVCFERPGSGRLAVSELDGKIVGGCYLRAELDDDGAHLKKYLEPVLKKCGLDKKQKHAKDGQRDSGQTGQTSSDVEESRTRNNSITESSHELSESELESQADVATPTTPNPPAFCRKSSDSSFVAPTFYPFSSLNLPSSGSASSYMPSGALTAESSSPGIGGFSPSFTTPCTPSSIDSGISLRTNVNSLASQSPGELTRLKPSSKTLPPMPAAPPPPLPPEEKAPPLPPQEQAVPPPPLSPPPPTSEERDGIENISSDEEDENSSRKAVENSSEKIKTDVDALSPVSLSPPNSPMAVNKLDLSSLSIRNQSNSKPTSSQFDPSLGLQTLLASRSAASSSTPQDVSSSPYVAVSPTPAPPTSYELEVEEISGDESPVMVYRGLEVESVSEDEDDNTEQGGEDMEVCSDDDNPQDNLIEVNVRPTGSAQIFPPLMGGPPPQMHPRPPPNSYDIPPPGPHSRYFPQRPPPPPGSFPPPAHAQPPLPFIPPHLPQAPHPPEMQPQGPHMMHRPPPFEFDSPLPANYPPHPPNGFVSYGSPSRFSPNFKSVSKKLKSNLPPPKDKKESISQEVLDKALWQLQSILLSDVKKKLIESYAYSALDSFWEKREKEKLVQQSSSDQPTADSGIEKPPKPYRSMLQGLKVEKEGEEEEEEEEKAATEEPSIPTPRKRLTNFKIPLLNRGGQRRDQNLSIVSRRRLFSEEVAEESPKRLSSKKPYYSSSHLSDISSSEDFSSDESEEEEEEEEGGESTEESESSEEELEELSSEDEEEELRKVFGGSSESETEEEARNELKSEPTVSAREESGAILKTKEAKPSKELQNDDEDDLTFRLPGSNLESSDLTKFPGNTLQTQFVKKPLPPPPPKPQFKRRSAKAEEEVVMGFVGRGGPDKEEVHMLKLAMARMKAEEEGEGEGEKLLGGMVWAHFPHIPLAAPPPKRRRVEQDDHQSGCARGQGYYKIDMREKKKYLPHHQVAHRMKHPTTSEPEMDKPLASGRVNRANQRRLASVFSSGDISSDLAKYNQLKARKKQLKFAKSTIHNWGLFAMENVAADEMVIEYVGEVVRQAVADERERRYEAAGIGSSYLFRVDHDYIIDATRNGNLARFINHCCDPNCYAKVISFGTQKKIVIYSKRDIAMGEEITYDYKFPIEEDKIPCLCGAPNCRGTLN